MYNLRPSIYASCGMPYFYSILFVQSSNFCLIDRDECLIDNGGCTDLCSNTDGSFICACTSTGYRLSNNRKSCVDIDECYTREHNCSDIETCVNTLGAHVCINSTANAGKYYTSIYIIFCM